MTIARNIFILAILLAPLPRLHADMMLVQVLEDLTNDTPTGKEQITLYVSGKHVRVDKGQSMTSIMLLDKKITFSIMHEGRKYLIFPHPPASDRDAKDAVADADFLASAKVEATGKTEKISGYQCKQVLIRDKKRGLTELWISEAALDMKTFLAEFKSFMSFGLPPVMNALDQHPELKGLPFRVIEYDGVKMARRSTITRLETAPLPPAVFEVPAGYAEVKMSDFDIPPQPERDPKHPKQ